MSIVRLRIPGLEFYRGLRGRESMIAFFGSMIAERRAGDGQISKPMDGLPLRLEALG
jgi:hypothetical protein